MREKKLSPSIDYAIKKQMVAERQVRPVCLCQAANLSFPLMLGPVGREEKGPAFVDATICRGAAGDDCTSVEGTYYFFLSLARSADKKKYEGNKGS